LHIRLVAGSGLTSFTEESARGHHDAPGGGIAGTFLVGGTPWPGVILGGGTHSFSPVEIFANGDKLSADTATVGPFVEWYPDPKTGWHFGALAGAGYAVLRMSGISRTRGVLGVTAIAGYDWWILPDWSLGINATTSASTAASLDALSIGAVYRLAPLSAALEVGLAFH
jgi:hypothetical protein